jgi:hypothetical protein
MQKFIRHVSEKGKIQNRAWSMTIRAEKKGDDR